MKIASIKELETYLGKFVPSVKKYEGEGLSLDRMWPLLEKAGNPHLNLKVIHIAGTSGKTSTAYYAAAILKKSGKTVGMTVSPHIDSIAERFQINGEQLTENELCAEFSEFSVFLEGMESDHRYFEVLMIFAMWLFDKKNVDYAVIETGLGGLYDASNVVTRNDKLCVITDIGIDHEHFLGDSLDKIAEKKAGIIHENNAVVTYLQKNEIMSPIIERIVEKNAKLHTLRFEEELSNHPSSLKRLPRFQKRNWLLASAVCEYIAKRDKFVLSDAIDPLSVVVPGRMELINESTNYQLIMDGAHNAQKMKAFVDSLVELYPSKKADILLALKEGKEYKKVLKYLLPVTESLIVTTFKTQQDLQLVSQNPEAIADFARKLGIETSIIKDNNKAYGELVKKDADLKVVTGSLYLLGQIR